jgi:hypothetical protein
MQIVRRLGRDAPTERRTPTFTWLVYGGTE